MSMKTEAIHSVYKANNHLGGAYSSQKQRKSNCRGFVDWCFKSNLPILSIKDATFDHVRAYLLELGLAPNQTQNGVEFEAQFFAIKGKKPLSISTLHNILSSIRRAMRALRRDPDDLGITALRLGLPQKSREGKKLPVTDMIFFDAINRANEAGEVGFALCLKIERYFGHRGLEAIMSPEELKKHALEAAKSIRLNVKFGSDAEAAQLPELTVRDGTKGGRLRQTVVIERYARESLEVIGEVMAFLSTNERLIEGKTKGLKSARAKYCALARKFGLTGQFSPHSLRYRYAVDKLCEMRDEGVSLEDALVLCAKFLGHGPTRGLFVRKVYGQSVVHTFSLTRQRRDFASAQAEIAAVLEHYFANKDGSSASLWDAQSNQPDHTIQDPTAPVSQ